MGNIRFATSSPPVLLLWRHHENCKFVCARTHLSQDQQNSRSTPDGFFGDHARAPISWMCAKRTPIFFNKHRAWRTHNNLPSRSIFSQLVNLFFSDLLDTLIERSFVSGDPKMGCTPAAMAAVDQEWGKLEKISAWNLTKVRNKSEVIDEARTKGRKVHFASLIDIMPFEECRIGGRSTKNTKVELFSEVTLQKTIRGLMQYSLNKDHQHHK